MLGVAVSQTDWDVVREFFELFKTPWEAIVPGRKYRVVLSAGGEIDRLDAEVVLIYSSQRHPVDDEFGITGISADGQISVEWGKETFPIYHGVQLFEPQRLSQSLWSCERAIDYRRERDGRIVRRLGYDLFQEIRYLLTYGQPVAHALTPTLDWHITILRHILLDSQVPVVEIPPLPGGDKFICCLTHDVDFFGIRRHRFDRTTAGFLYRASIGSVIDFLKGQRSFDEAVRNWSAVIALPFVHLGLVKDYWSPFEDYAQVEDCRRSTFFLIPYRGKPGRAPDGSSDPWRASPYEISQLTREIRRAAEEGSELGVHGIDAWRDNQAGREEMAKLAAAAGKPPTGIRMHWLYFDLEAYQRLDEAGFSYDSTCGYNETVGYRAGTSQVFRPLKSQKLLELPMSIMDSAMFSSGRMNLGRKSAFNLCRRVIENARQFGGTVVINWHDRSLAPERLWGRFYKELLDEIERDNQAWFVTASQAVEWFRWRRSIQFHWIPKGSEPSGFSFQISAPRSHSRGAVVRVRRPGVPTHASVDRVFDGTASIVCEA